MNDGQRFYANVFGGAYVVERNGWCMQRGLCCACGKRCIMTVYRVPNLFWFHLCFFKPNN